MQKQWFSILLSLSICMPFFSYAADDAGYIGKALGLDFYSVIDDGSYSLTNQMVRLELEKTKTLGELWIGCPGIEYIGALPTDEKILNYGSINYARLSEALRGKTLTIDTYQWLVICLQERYAGIVKQKGREIDRLQKISSVGLYTDGDTTNSDYDIITDINKIDKILFSEPLKYEGVKNTSSKALSQSLFLGVIPLPLIPETSGISPGKKGSNSGELSSGNTGTINTKKNSEVIGELCTSNNTSIPIDSIMDERFMYELGNTLKWDRWIPVGERYGEDASIEVKWTGSNSSGSLTSASDFFHPKWSCGGIFCIDVRIIWGSANALGWGKTPSIQSILEKHQKILEIIEPTNLKCQKMTNNNGQSPSKSPFTLGGLNVIIAKKWQPTKRFKSEVTPKTKSDELSKIAQCSYASVGLSTDLTQANGPSIAGYSLNTATTMGNIYRRSLTIKSQSIDQWALAANCFDLYMDQGRSTYYNSLMNDVTEIEVFTRSLAQTLTDIVNIGTGLDKKPVGCK